MDKLGRSVRASGGLRGRLWLTCNSLPPSSRLSRRPLRFAPLVLSLRADALIADINTDKLVALNSVSSPSPSPSSSAAATETTAAASAVIPAERGTHYARFAKDEFFWKESDLAPLPAEVDPEKKREK